MTTRGFSLVGLATLVAAMGGCSSGASATDPGAPSNEAVNTGREPIIGGTPATGFPEAVLVDIQQNGQTTMGCSGTVIAPNVVLTAGHCVADGDGWNITAPYASGQTAHGSSSATFDWTQTDDDVSPDEHDVGLVFLDAPISLATYPTIATAGLADGAQIVTVGRVKGGQMSRTALYQSPGSKVKSGTPSYGFKFDYAAPIVIEHGDSGGASYSVNTHMIVAVNSTGDTKTMLIARVDLVSSWIAQQIASHADGGQGGGQGGGGEGGGGQGGGGEGGGPGGGGQGGDGPGGGGGPGGPHGGGPPGQNCVYNPWRGTYYCW